MSWAIRLLDVPDGTGDETQPGTGFAYHIRIVGPWPGWWLKSYEPEKYEGLGQANFVEDPAEAMRFPTFEAAKELWWTQSATTPQIRDGRGRMVENRPLAVVSISIDEVAD